MSLKVKAELEGLKEMEKILKSEDKKIRAALRAALYQKGFRIMSKSLDQCPADFGFLRGSGYVSPPRSINGRPEVEIGYGKDYAIPVHEKDARHPVGKKFYLRDPFNEETRGYVNWVAAKTRENAKRGIGVGKIAREEPETPDNNRIHPNAPVAPPLLRR